MSNWNGQIEYFNKYNSEMATDNKIFYLKLVFLVDAIF